MTTLLVFTMSLFIAYIAIITCMFGWLPSISDSFYKLQELKKGAGYWFTGWCFAMGMLSAALMLDVSAGEWYQFLGFISGGALCFVGAAPHFKSTERVIHSVSALLCAVPAILFCCLSGNGLVTGITLTCFTGIWIFAVKENPIFWAEVSAFVTTFITLTALILA